MSFFSHQVARMRPSATMQVTQRARDLRAQGRDIISLSTGEPDFDTPEPIKAAAARAAAAGKTKYTPVNGIVELRQAAADKLQRDNRLHYDAAEILVCNGAKQAIANALVATLNPGDEVLIPVPYWVSYPELVGMLGGVAVFVPTAAPSFKLTPEALERAITPQTKWLVLNSPCNPSGATYALAELQALGEVLLRHPHVHVLADDIYEHLVYDGVQFATLAEAVPELQPRTLVVNGVSKAYAMTGWRIGYAAGRADLIKAMLKVQSQMTSGPNAIAQWAAAAALNGPMDAVMAFRDAYAQRRRLAGGILDATPGLSCALPQGAFYLFPDCAAWIGKRLPDGRVIEDDVAFCTALLEGSGVATVPGTAFGRPGHFRVSFATDTETLEAGCRRIAAFCASLA